jgi:multiple sugar transport system substrate-binding protein
MWSGEWLPVIDNVADEFNRSQDTYEVIPLQIPWGDSDAKLLLSVAGGNPPDVMVQWTQAISAWSQAGVLQPLDTLMTASERRHFLQDCYPAVRNNGWYRGHLYGLTAGFDVYACYWRPSEFRAAGLDPDHFPQTLEALVAAGRKLDRYDGVGNLTRLGFMPSSFTQYAPAFGGGLYDSGSGQVLLDTPQNLRALSYLVSTNEQVGLDRVLRFNAGLKSTDGSNWPFIGGQVAIALDGEWRIQQLSQFAPALDYRVSPLPPPAVGGKKLASWSTADFLTIPVGAREKEGAWAFIKFWSGLDHPERAAKFQAAFGWLPTSPQMAGSPDYQAYLRKFPQYRTFVSLAASNNIATVPPVPYQLFLMDHVQTADDLAGRGTLTPEEALHKLEGDVAAERALRKELGYDD